MPVPPGQSRSARRRQRRAARRRGLGVGLAITVMLGAGGSVVVVAADYGLDLLTDDGIPEDVPPERAAYRPSERTRTDSQAAAEADSAAPEQEWTSYKVTGKPKQPDLDRLTTPTQRIIDNGDGTYMAEVGASPTRLKDEDGNWREFDGTIVRKDGDRWGAKVSAVDATVARRSGGDGNQASGGPGRSGPSRRGEADDPLVVVPTDAGDIGLSHPDAADVVGEVVDHYIRFTDALSDGRDLIETVLPQSVDESVVLESATGGSYVVELHLPPGTSARDGELGVEIVDDADRIVAVYAPGRAWDAARTTTGGRAETPVRVALVSQSA